MSKISLILLAHIEGSTYKLAVRIFTVRFDFRTLCFIIICNNISTNQPFTEVDILTSCRAERAVGLGCYFFTNRTGHLRRSFRTERSRLRFSSPCPKGVQPTNSVATGQVRREARRATSMGLRSRLPIGAKSIAICPE